MAASARQRGLDVTVVEPASVPLERVLGKEIGAVYRDIHTDQGVRMLMGTGVEAFEGDGVVERVRTSDGQVIDCDFVVVGVGVQPRTALAAQAGLAVDNGVLVDEHLQTSVPGVFAAVMWPIPATPSTASGSASSTGPTPSTKGRPPPATWSATTWRTTGSRTSSPTSTTSAWSTRASLEPGTALSSAAIPRRGSSLPSGWSRIAWSRA